jgi:hypothetical protein
LVEFSAKRSLNSIAGVKTASQLDKLHRFQGLEYGAVHSGQVKLVFGFHVSSESQTPPLGKPPRHANPLKTIGGSIGCILPAGRERLRPPGVVRDAAFQAAMAASVNHTVRLPRCRSASLYSAQFVTRRFGRGIWWRRSALYLCGMKARSGASKQIASYAIRHIRATR